MTFLTSMELNCVSVGEIACHGGHGGVFLSNTVCFTWSAFVDEFKFRDNEICVRLVKGNDDMTCSFAEELEFAFIGTLGSLDNDAVDDSKSLLDDLCIGGNFKSKGDCDDPLASEKSKDSPTASLLLTDGKNGLTSFNVWETALCSKDENSVDSVGAIRVFSYSLVVLLGEGGFGESSLWLGTDNERKYSILLDDNGYL